MATGTVSFLPWLRFGVSNKITIADNFQSSVGTLGNQRAQITTKVEITRHKPDGTSDTHSIPKSINLIGPGDIKMLDPQEVKAVSPEMGEKEFEYNHLAFIEFKAADLPWRFTPAQATVPYNSSNPDIPDPNDPNDPPQSPTALRPWLSLVVLKTNEFTRLDFNGFCRPIKIKPEVVPSADGLFTPHDQTWAWAHVQVNKNIVENTLEQSIAELTNHLHSDPSIAFSRIICPRRLEKNTQYQAFLIPTFEIGRLQGLGESTDDVDGLTPAWEYDGTILSQYSFLSPYTFPVYYEWSFFTAEQAGFETMAKRIKATTAENFQTEKFCLSHAHPVLEGKMPVKTSPDTDLPSVLRPMGAPALKYWLFNDSKYVEELAGLINTPYTPNNVGDPIFTPPFYGRWHAQKTNLQLPVTDPDWLHELNLDVRYRVMAGLGADMIRKNQDSLMDTAWKQIEEVMEANNELLAMQAAQLVQYQQYTKRIPAPGPDSNALLALIVGPQVHKTVLNPGNNKTLHFDFKSSNLPKAVLSGQMRSLMTPGGKLAKSFSPDDPINGTRDWLQQLADGNASCANEYVTPAAIGPLQELTPEQLTEGYVNLIEPKEDFVLTKPGCVPDGFTPGGDNDQANFFREVVSQAHGNNFEYFKDKPVLPMPPPPDFASAAEAIYAGIDPKAGIAEHISGSLGLVEADSQSGYSFFEIGPVLASPKFDRPLGEALFEQAPEYMIQGLSDILKNNTATAFETDYKALEAYMVGANVEMARELLWRGYPTDQRGTCFQHFWRALDNDFTDISPIHTWRNGWPLTKLGENNPSGGGPINYLILAIRADLLRKFPHPIIVMRKAIITNPQYIGLEDYEYSVSETEIKLPVFYSLLGTDTMLLGFEIDKNVALGSRSIAEPGWFFCIQESPTGIRFGLDEYIIDPSQSIESWNQLQWGHIEGNNQALEVDISIGAPTVNYPDNAAWAESAADMASILYRPQAEIAIHARRMLM